MLTAPLVPCLRGLQLDRIDAVNRQITVTLKSVQAELVCPLCGQIAQAVHSWYWHNVAYSPGHGYVVSLVPEFVALQDGGNKQDSEAAAQR